MADNTPTSMEDIPPDVLAAMLNPEEAYVPDQAKEIEEMFAGAATAQRRRRIPMALTPGEACDTHIDLVSWFGTEVAANYVHEFNQMFSLGNNPFDWDAATSGREGARVLHDKLSVGDTFYVTADMQRIAMDAAEDLEGMPLFPHDLPGRSALIILDTSAGFCLSDFDMTNPHLPKIDFPVRAVLVEDSPQSTRLVVNGEPVMGPEGLVNAAAITTFYDIDSVQSLTGNYPFEVPPPALLGDFITWPYGLPWVSMAPGETQARHTTGKLTTTRVPAHNAHLRRFLASVMGLMREERYAERERPERAAVRRWKRSSLNVPDDYCVSVTRLRRPHRRAEDTGGDGEARYSHQWLVRGHWRRIHKGTDQERAVFVHPHLKGPEGAPFIVKRKMSRLEK